MKVLTFGTFDHFHPGHEFYLQTASQYGEVYVVIARDETVKQVKGNYPDQNEEERKLHVSQSPFVKKAILGNFDDKYQVLSDIKPNIICLGYDQKAFTDKLLEEITRRNITAKILRIGSFKPETYKSSIVRREKATQQKD